MYLLNKHVGKIDLQPEEFGIKHHVAFLIPELGYGLTRNALNFVPI